MMCGVQEWISRSVSTQEKFSYTPYNSIMIVVSLTGLGCQYIETFEKSSHNWSVSICHFAILNFSYMVGSSWCDRHTSA
jgi:hypothetical protein